MTYRLTHYIFYIEIMMSVTIFLVLQIIRGKTEKGLIKCILLKKYTNPKLIRRKCNEKSCASFQCTLYYIYIFTAE